MTFQLQPYIPSFLKASLTETRPVQLTFSDLVETNKLSTSSFKYEPLNYGIKSTQQLNVDWSKFQNHTFFMSAEVKTNVAFDQVINGYPFDGTKKEVEGFLEGLSGFEKWVFDQFPTFGGQLHFSGTQASETSPYLGTYVTIKDVAGWLYPDISKNKTGESILNPPSSKSFAIEFHAFVPDQSNGRQVVFQRQSDDKTEGFTFHLEPSSGNTVSAFFSIVSGGVYNHVQTTLMKGQFNHICLALNRESGPDYMEFFVNEEFKASSNEQKEIGDFAQRPNLLLGSGSSFYVTGALVTPTQTFSGSLDEFRFFHAYRSIKQQQLYASKGIYTNDSLKLYYRFNEPPSAYSPVVADTINSIVLDSSGNSLHGTINNYTVYGSASLRRSSTDDLTSLMTNEKSEFKKILFPLDTTVTSLNEELLQSASLYDTENPNLITKLIPRHYLREGAAEEGFADAKIDGSIGDAYGEDGGIPGQGKLGSTQILLTFLYIWAKFFDEMKMFADAFKTLRTVKYDLEETIPNNFLSDFVKSYGFYLPPLFNSSNLNQYVDAEDITQVGVSDLALKEVQSQLLRRVLVNMPDIIKSKGTQHSVKSFLRSIGVDPDNSLRIREFGGPSLKQLEASRELKIEPGVMAKISGTNLVKSAYLSGSRVEPGYPVAQGPFVKGVSSNRSDGLFTSGSWTYEAIYKFPVKENLYEYQSLARMLATGSATTAQPGLLLNLVASGGLHLFVRSGLDGSAPLLHLSLTDVDVYNGDKWNVSFGRYRDDEIDSLVSSSYFLRAASQLGGEISEYYSTSSFFLEDVPVMGVATDFFKSYSATYNASGSWLALGGGCTIPDGAIGYLFLNDTMSVDNIARTTDFSGRVSNVRFWSKALTEVEWREHVKNYKSAGVESPSTNYNYVTNKSGSFGKLRMSAIEKQADKYADTSGNIRFLDFSENNIHLTASGYEPESRVLFGELFNRSYLSPYFDEYSTSEKVRIRGFQNEENLVDAPWAVYGRALEYPAEEIPLDDPRLSIEFSLLDSLNKDIVNIFATYDELATAIGSPNLIYSPDYPALENLRNVYFNRLSEKLNFRSFFEFYRWFDVSVSAFIEQLVPRKTRFKGTNFVIESHMLERHKLEYQSSEIYLGDSTRGRQRDLLFQQIVGKINKF